jgi:hypothetical protein
MKIQKTKATKPENLDIPEGNVLSTEEERIQYLAMWEHALRKDGFLSDDEEIQYGETISEFKTVKKPIDQNG